MDAIPYMIADDAMDWVVFDAQLGQVFSIEQRLYRELHLLRLQLHLFCMN